MDCPSHSGRRAHRQRSPSWLWPDARTKTGARGSALLPITQAVQSDKRGLQKLCAKDSDLRQVRRLVRSRRQGAWRCAVLAASKTTADLPWALLERRVDKRLTIVDALPDVLAHLDLAPGKLLREIVGNRVGLSPSVRCEAREPRTGGSTMVSPFVRPATSPVYERGTAPATDLRTSVLYPARLGFCHLLP